MKKKINNVIQVIKKDTWKLAWAGKWTLLACSDYGEHNTTVKIHGGGFINTIVYVFKNGEVSCWMNEKELDGFSRRVARYVGYSLSRATQVARGMITKTDNALKFMRTKPQYVDLYLYEKYLKVIRNYYQFHLQVKYIVDGLDQKGILKFLKLFKKARVHAEPVFDETLKFDYHIAKQVSKRSRSRVEYCQFMTRDELKNFFAQGITVPTRVLKDRAKLSVMIFIRGKPYILTGKNAKRAVQSIVRIKSKKILHGSVAYTGKVRGIARIVTDTNLIKRFKTGDILVARSTRPDFTAFMKKAAAFVTDSGGLLAHAAITAREMKKPCVIGTKFATKIFKDGDRIEVDAEKGIVRKIT